MLEFIQTLLYGDGNSMVAVWPMIIMAAVGAVQGQRKQEAAQKAHMQNVQQAAIQTAASPHLGGGPGRVEAVRPVDGAFEGALSGAALGSSIGKSPFSDALSKTKSSPTRTIGEIDSDPTQLQAKQEDVGSNKFSELLMNKRNPNPLIDEENRVRRNFGMNKFTSSSFGGV